MPLRSFSPFGRPAEQEIGALGTAASALDRLLARLGRIDPDNGVAARSSSSSPASSSSSSDANVRARSLFANSVDAKTIVAEFHYYHNNFAKCHELTQAILEADSHAHACLAYHLSSLVELKSSRELFIDAHRLVDSFPDTAEAWYAVGCYYYLCNKFEKARINFLKATSLNAYFAPAWLGYGHTFAAQDESDQALASARRGDVLVMVPEVLRGKGDVLAELGRADEADYAYENAVLNARAQGAVPLQLRALTALLKHRQRDDFSLVIRNEVQELLHRCQMDPASKDVIAARGVLSSLL